MKGVSFWRHREKWERKKYCTMKNQFIVLLIFGPWENLIDIVYKHHSWLILNANSISTRQRICYYSGNVAWIVQIMCVRSIETTLEYINSNLHHKNGLNFTSALSLPNTQTECVSSDESFNRRRNCKHTHWYSVHKALHLWPINQNWNRKKSVSFHKNFLGALLQLFIKSSCRTQSYKWINWRNSVLYSINFYHRSMTLHSTCTRCTFYMVFSLRYSLNTRNIIEWFS